MSNHRWAASSAAPYFAFVAEGIGDLTTLPPDGVTWLGLRVRIDSLPVQLSSADELHPLLSFCPDVTSLSAAVLELGVTPSGRFKCVAKNGDTIQTSSGLIADSTRWYNLFANYDYLGATFSLQGDVGVLGTATLGAPLLPAAGTSTRIVIFNGKSALTRMGASIARAQVEFQGVGASAYSYRFTEKSGSTLTPTRDGSGTGAGIYSDFIGTNLLAQNYAPAIVALGSPAVATAVAFNPLTTSPWGAIPDTVPAYEWGLATDYTRLPKPTTRFTRIAA